MVEALASAGAAPVSIDTSKLAVAEAALDAGAAIVNDVTALRAEPELAGLCAERGVELVLMHMQGDPRTMQENPTYDDVVDDVKAFLAERIEFATCRGVAEERIWVDPGIGFGKTVEHNLELLRRLGELARARPPDRWSAPRARASSASSPARRWTSGSAARSPPACSPPRTAPAMLRVHDVGPVREALTRRRGDPASPRARRRRAMLRRALAADELPDQAVDPSGRS